MVALIIDVGWLAIGTALLLVGADWFSGWGGRSCPLACVSALVLGVLLAGLEPEEMLTAAIVSARGAPALAVGNVIGTNVTITTAALGLSTLIFPTVINPSVRRQAVIATLVSIIPMVLLLLGMVTQFAGIFLLIVFVGYTIFLFKTDQEAVKRIHASKADDDDDDDWKGTLHSQQYWKPALLTVGGLAAMAVGGPALVEGALRLAQTIGIGQGAIGATIISLGTGAEMIALGVRAAGKKRSDILIGGILGSFAYNLLVTLGLAAAIHPLSVDPHITFVALPGMIVAHLILLACVWYGKVPRVIGGLLVVAYLVYLIAVVLA